MASTFYRDLDQRVKTSFNINHTKGIICKSFLRDKIGFQRCSPIGSNAFAGRDCELKLAVKRAHRGLLAVSANALLPMGRASLEPDSGPPEWLTDYSFDMVDIEASLNHLITVPLRSRCHNLKVMLVSHKMHIKILKIKNSFDWYRFRSMIFVGVFIGHMSVGK